MDKFTEEFDGFSPLRYWGGLYQQRMGKQFGVGVLVPFDIGVVYINDVKYNGFPFEF